MRIRYSTLITIAIFAVVYACVTACYSSQSSAQYAMEQEKKNSLIAMAGENVDTLRSCLSPYSRMSQSGPGFSIDPKKVSELVAAAGAVEEK